MNACEALFFPSYFEAFSLVEIEASRLGLPLYLTPHHGSEMILKEGVNGKSVPFDAQGIAGILQQDLERGIKRVDPPVHGKALATSEYASAVYALYSQVLEN